MQGNPAPFASLGRELGLPAGTCPKVPEPGRCSRYEFARTILEYTGKTGDLDLYPVVARDDVRPTYSVLDNMMLRLTGIPEPPDWKTALKEYLEETGGIE